MLSTLETIVSGFNGCYRNKLILIFQKTTDLYTLTLGGISRSAPAKGKTS